MDLEESTSENVAASSINRSRDFLTTPMKLSKGSRGADRYRYDQSPFKSTGSEYSEVRIMESSLISPPHHLDTAESVNVSNIYRSGASESFGFKSFLSTTRGSHVFPTGSQESLAQKVKNYQAETDADRERIKERLLKLEEEITFKIPEVKINELDRYETAPVSEWKSQLPFDLNFGDVVKADMIDEHEMELSIRNPTLKWCGFCKAERKTNVVFETSAKTFWSSVAIFFMGGVFGCFMLPYYSNQCKNPKLVCHKCKRGV